MTEAAATQEGKKSSAAKALANEPQTQAAAPVSKTDAKKALKVLQGGVSSVTDLITDTASSVEHLDAESALKLIPELVDGVEYNNFKLGGVLCRMQEENWWKASGHETFKSYLDAEHGLGYRKAMYLIDIYRNLVDSGVSWESVKNVGWTKLRVLAPILTQENAAEWVARAETMTTIQLEEYIKNVKAANGAGSTGGTSSSTSSNVVSKTFKLHSDQVDIIEAALDKCKNQKSTEHDNVALQYICEEWAAGAIGKTKSVSLKDSLVSAGLEAALKALEEAFPEADFKVEL